MDGTLVPSSPTFLSEEEIKYPVPSISVPPLEQKVLVTPVAATEKKILEYNNTNHYPSSITDYDLSEAEEDGEDKIIQQEKEKYERRFKSTGELPKLAICQKSINQSLNFNPKK
jgi:hypothetical protein